MKRLDLHTHSTASDGTFSPSEVAALAKSAGLAGAALCDHDTVDGLEEFLAAGRRLDFLTVGGVELSLEHEGTTHLLGLGVASVETGVPSALEEVKNFRRDRNLKLLERLAQLGIVLSWERLEEISGGGQMGRPHFARAMVEAGFSSNIQEAFNSWLAKGRPGYVEKRRFSPEPALAMLRRAGFAPVLAHPITLRLSPDRWPRTLIEWKDWGLAGLEVHHPDHDSDFTAFMAGLCRRFGLAATAGSDFHGANKRTPITWTRDNSPVGAEVLERLREALG